MSINRYPKGFNQYETPFGRSRSYKNDGSIVGGPPTDIEYQQRQLAKAGHVTYFRGTPEQQQSELDQSIVNKPNIGDDATRIKDNFKYGDFTPINVLVTTDPVFVLPRPQYVRVYLLVQNNNATGNLYLGFNSLSSPINGILVSANSFYEMENVVPQNDIFMVSDVVLGLNITLTYCNMT